MLKACYLLGNNTPSPYFKVKEMAIKEEYLKGILQEVFNPYSYALTFTIKGTRRGENLKSIKAQKDYIKKLIGDIIEPRSLQFIVFYEYHSCGDYLHVHGIVNHRSHNQFRLARKEIWQAINASDRRIVNYKPCVDYNKVSCLSSWLKYIIKDYTFMKDMSSILPLYNFDSLKYCDDCNSTATNIKRFLHNEELINNI